MTGSPEASPTMPLDDQHSREAFVDAEYEGVFAWLTWLCGSRDTGADLTQDTFAAFWASLQHKDIREPRVWLYRIARNRWRKWCRDSRRHEPGDGTEALASSLLAPDDSAERSEFVRAATDALAALPRPDREAIALRYWGDLDHRRIGQVLGIPTSLARWRVHRARARLREAMKHVVTPTGGAS
jgi:RNA polymerase sigma-70 factor (ECF subfamily)